MIENVKDLLTVIVPTSNRKDLLRNCLLSLQRQTVAASILVVDNGSRDSTGAMVQREFPGVDLHVTREPLGFARAVNQGIRSSRTPCLALLNNDAEAEPGWVETGLRALTTRPEYDFFASRMIQYERRNLLDSAGDGYSRSGLPFKKGFGEGVDRYPEEVEVLGASAGAAFYRRSLFEKLGFFDEDFHMYLEDVEFSLRARLAGHRCLYLPDAVVFHWEAASDPQRLLGEGTNQGGPGSGFYSTARVYWITRNRWLLMVIYQPLRNLPWLLGGWARSTAFHLLKGGFFFSYLKGLAAGLLQTPRAISKRRKTREFRTISTRELCRLLRRF